MKLLKTETYEEQAKIIDIYGQGCNYPTGKGVDGFQVEFTVKKDDKELLIIFQNSDREDNLKAYNGYEMDCAINFGLDCDDSGELNEEETDLLRIKASELCREYLNENINE